MVAAIADIAGELERQRAARAPYPVIAIELGRRRAMIRGTLASDSTLLTMVGLPNKPYAPAAAAWRAPCRACLRDFQQGGLFAADIGAGADAHFNVEGVRGAEDARPRDSRRVLRDCDRLIHRRDRMRIFGADVDVTLSRRSRRRRWSCLRSGRKGSPSMTMRSAKVPQSPSSALHTIYFSGGPQRPATVFHLMPAGNPRRRGRAGPIGDLLDQFFGTSGAPARGPRSRRARVFCLANSGRRAAARKGQPRLTLEERVVFGDARAQRAVAPPAAHRQRWPRRRPASTGP